MLLHFIVPSRAKGENVLRQDSPSLSTAVRCSLCRAHCAFGVISLGEELNMRQGKKRGTPPKENINETWARENARLVNK